MNANETVRDFVCLMEVESGNFSFDFQGRNFSFCSSQCRDRFERNPHLYIGFAGKPAPKQKGESIIKRRILKLDKPVSENEGTQITNYLQSMMGIKELLIDGHLISITYDLLEVTTQQIENKIEQSGNLLGQGLGTKLKSAFIHYTEETQLDNLEMNDNSHGCHHK